MKKSELRKIIKENITTILSEESYRSILLDKIKKCKLSEEEKAKLIADLKNPNNFPKIAAKLEKGGSDLKENEGLSDIEDRAYEDGVEAFTMAMQANDFKNKPDTKAYMDGFFQGFRDEAGALGLNEVVSFDDDYNEFMGDVFKYSRNKNNKDRNWEDEIEQLVNQLDISDIEAADFLKSLMIIIKPRLNEQDEPTKADLENDSDLTINATKLGEISQELKTALNAWKKSKGEEKAKHLEDMKRLTKLKKELESSLDENSQYSKSMSDKDIENSKLMSINSKLLLDKGWERAPHWYSGNSYIKNLEGGEHQITLNPNKPNLINTWRFSPTGEIEVDGIIGDFIGGKGRKRQTPLKWFLNDANLNNFKKY